MTDVQMSVDSFVEKECEIAGVIINKADPENQNEYQTELERAFGKTGRMLSVIPSDKRIGSPTMRDIVERLNAEVLYGGERLDNQSDNYMIAAMQLDNVIDRLRYDNCLVITPGDRTDIILAALQAHQSKNFPPMSGILLSTGLKPSPAIDRLIAGLDETLPILSVEFNTFETAARLQNINSTLHSDEEARIAYAKQLFENNVDIATLEAQLQAITVRGMTPKMFQYNLVQKARASKKRIVLPEAMDHRILKATAMLTSHDIAEIILLGNAEEIIEESKKANVEINWEQVEIIDPASYSKFEDYANTYYEQRKHKGVTPEYAKDTMTDVSYFGTMMVYKGDADGMVSGAINTTAHTIRPALQFVKTKPGVSVVSSVFFMSLPDKVLVYGDCAVNPNPNPEQLAEIAISSAETAIAFGIEPKVAMLSYSSGSSGSGEEVEKVRKATEIAQAKRPDLKIEGPIQYDAAVDPTVGAKKMPGSEVAGQANVLIFPDLNTGNNTYKAVQRETGAIAIGPMLQGLNKPVNDLSRGALVEDIINTVVITSIQADNK
ncbi:phosphate acetyltransferase [Limibacter armeniacum]|uniref:phosphate acetyltransferase n=1 Tax=Limibacter armeniacum TaxID=466084 RepID=UPI002FE609C5